jgi:hypothetical protein
VVKARRVFKSSHLDAVLDLQDFVDLMASAYNQMTLS